MAELLGPPARERDAFAALIERYQGVVSAVSYSPTGDRALSEDRRPGHVHRRVAATRHCASRAGWPAGCVASPQPRPQARRERARAPPTTRWCSRAPTRRVAAAAESSGVVRDALMRVPDTYRDLLVLYYRDQRSVRDVAVALAHRGGGAAAPSPAVASTSPMVLTDLGRALAARRACFAQARRGRARRTACDRSVPCRSCSPARRKP